MAHTKVRIRVGIAIELRKSDYPQQARCQSAQLVSGGHVQCGGVVVSNMVVR